jgi:hypothetical protein
MPKRSKRFGRVLKGEASLSKRRRTNHNLDVNLDVTAPLNETTGLIQDPLESANDETHVPINPDNISQLKRKVCYSAAMKEKYVQLVGELKQQVKDLKHNANESDTAHAKLVADLKSKYCELAQDKQRDKKSVNNLSVCHQPIHCLK